MKITDKTKTVSSEKVERGMYFLDIATEQYYICVETWDEELRLFNLETGVQYGCGGFSGETLEDLYTNENMKRINVKELIFK